MPGLVKEQLETSGARKAVLIGICYDTVKQHPGDGPRVLPAAHKDVDVMKKILMGKCG